MTSSFVVGAEGSVTSPDGTSKGLGNASDLELLKTLRRNSNVVLTSGLTARLEHYKMPATADLAIFTSHGVNELSLNPKPGQGLLILSPPAVASYSAALTVLKAQYAKVHVEFGPRGFGEILGMLDLVVISSRSRIGVERFIESSDLEVESSFELPNLFVTLCVGRGKGKND
jgi:hypothetical protein